ncbi:type VI secretion system protein TssR domain-containing protein [Geofilum rubicundum]|uniref:Uncharacterized protein n=1 Tax=Geofilum rubicundum JCM 15548 TaxID=1236989 RepID=A0A0E9M0Z7_9BACT|nr:type VI secretion system protein TssR domain-containing protein [Geofilum rubicundum]GAO31046.1 hypothetical protein JCM15548_13381 [Geofilum rubicundum JCM 15548]
MKYNKTFLIYILVAIVTFCACGPVNRLTTLEKTPRAYSMNYCATDIKAPKSILNNAAWVVYSDRENNVSYRKPGSRHKQSEIGFLEPFLVIGQKGDFLQIIKYDPEITKDDQLTDHKAAEYYGWIHKSRLILSPKGSTNMANNLANKQLITLTDTTTLQHPANFFSGDSVKLYKDPHLRLEGRLVALHEVVYLLKYSDDQKRVLIARRSELTPEDAETDVLGWVSKKLIQSIGQQLFWDMTAVLKNEKRDDLNYVKPPALQFNPVYDRNSVEGKKVIESGLLAPLVDKSDNYVFNVNGKAITYNQSQTIEANLKRLNIVFVIEAGEVTYDQFPTLVNAVQNMQTTFEENERRFNYQFGSVISMTKNDTVPVVHSAPLHHEFPRVLETLIDRSANMEAYTPLSSEHAWKGLKEATNLLRNETEATNIILLLGETGNHLEWPDAEIKQRLSATNCRLLGLQMYSGSPNFYNNFVLQISQIIEGYANNLSEKKKSIILFPNQLREENAFKEDGKNAYMLNFPDRSMTQGGIVFPEKEERLALEVITSSIDTFLLQIKADNLGLINNLHAAFNTFGSHRDKYDSLLVKTFQFYPENNNLHVFKEHFETLPGWFKTEQVETSLTDLPYHLLVSGVEFDNLISFMEKLTAFKVEKKEKRPLFFRTKKTKSTEPESCDCAILTDSRGYDEETGTDIKWKYRSTKKIRKEIQEILLTELRQNSYEQKKKRVLKKYTLKQALNTITHSPNVFDTSNPVTIKSLSKKKKISDARLELLLEYFNVKKNDIENSISDKNKFISLEQEYFWINSIHLP